MFAGTVYYKLDDLGRRQFAKLSKVLKLILPFGLKERASTKVQPTSIKEDV